MPRWRNSRGQLHPMPGGRDGEANDVGAVVVDASSLASGPTPVGLGKPPKLPSLQPWRLDLLRAFQHYPACRSVAG